MSQHPEYLRGYQAGYHAAKRGNRERAHTPSPQIIEPSPTWQHELRYMIGRGWLFSGTLVEAKWKSDPDLAKWVERGWVEMDSTLGFRITPKGEEVARA